MPLTGPPVSARNHQPLRAREFCLNSPIRSVVHCRSITIAVTLCLAPATARAQSFDYHSQNRKVFAEARPAEGKGGENFFRFAPAFDPFAESVAASWLITDPVSGLASAEAQQSSTLSATNISAAGFSFALANNDALFASSFSFFEVTFSLSEPTTLAFNAVAGGVASILLQGPGVDVLVIDDTIITQYALEPGEYLLRADSTSSPLPSGEKVGSFHLVAAIVPAPAGAPFLMIALRLRRRERRN